MAFFDDFAFIFTTFRLYIPEISVTQAKDSKNEGLAYCTMSNFRDRQNGHFLTIFGNFWYWKCYQIDGNIFQTVFLIENHQRKYNILMYHSYNPNFLSWNGWFFVFWKLIGEVPYTHFFKNGLKWSHICWRNLG